MKILIIRMSSIGDVILTTPVITELRKKYPDAIIDFIVLDKFYDSISLNPELNNIIKFEKEKYKGYFGIKRFTNLIKKENYDVIIDLHSKIRSKLISQFLGVKTYRYKKRSWWKTLLVKLKLIRYNVDDTIIKNYFGAVKDLGIVYKGEKLRFSYSNDDLKRVKVYDDYIVFAPGASKETKKWTKQNFAQLAVLLNRYYDKKILLIGGKSEYEELEIIKDNAGEFVINLAGKLSLKESGALLSKAEFLVTNDSGPFHIGRGVGCKSFVIFGPTDPGMFEYNEDAILLYNSEPCSPCSLHGDKVCPKGHFNCMTNLTGEKVFNIIKDSLNG